VSEENDDTGHHPSTFKAVRTNPGGIEWDDHATIHRKDDGQGLFDGLKALHRGTLAEMITLISRMPEDQRDQYVIQKAGDRKISSGEIMALASREDFPSRG
jgi:hypothetical protein